MDSCGGPGTQTSVPRNKNQRRPSRRDSFYRGTTALGSMLHGATALGGDRARAIVRVASQRGAWRRDVGKTYDKSSVRVPIAARGVARYELLRK